MRTVCAALLTTVLVQGGAPLRPKSHAQAPGAPFRAHAQLNLQALERAVRTGAPAISAARREVSQAEADTRQARLWNNPSLEAAWSTIPLGSLNPRDLERPMANVPNYEAALSYTIPWAKRGAARQRADALAVAARANLDLVARELSLELAEVLGRLATATLRHQGISTLLASGRRAMELAEARLAAKFGTPIDVDQLRIDVQRHEQLMVAAEADTQTLLAACSRLVATPCESFADVASARAYLTRWIDAALPSERSLAERPDLRALGAQRSAAQADANLAHAARLPDPTVRVGYVHDRFLVSGNQRNSVNVAVSLPLPVFDRGQVHQKAAEAARDSLAEERARRIAVSQARLPALHSRLSLARERCQRLDGEVVPKASEVLSSLESAAEGRLLPLPQVIQARRILSELVIEAADSCGDAYLAALELLREVPAEGAVP